MRVLRRRAAAMSPRERHVVILLALGALLLGLYFIPTFLSVTLILAALCIACYYLSRQQFPARQGLKPRAGVNLPPVLRRWLRGWGATGASLAARVAPNSGRNKAETRDSAGNFRERNVDSGIYRRETLASESFLFSPRELLMGSYIGKPEGPTADPARPRAGRNPREQLREKLTRPNHAVYTPNRRLSFAGELPGTMSRFTITPQRHYPLQQPGVSSVGILPPVRWDGFRKKNILSPRNSPGVLSPVTVKIARPLHHSSPSLDPLSGAALPRAPVDPCSRESVLKVLKDSRKREVEDEDKSFTAEQESKRRRHDSGGSARSAAESLLPNGAPPQLVPRPGNMKRGITSLAEDSIMKRSRTSSISSGSGVHALRGTPGTRRNPIQSSYSSSLGLSQWKKRSAASSPLSSPGSSRCQTPEGASKRPREDDGLSPSAAASLRPDHTASDKTPAASTLTPGPPAPASAGSPGSGGKRKRKIQLVSSNRDDHISLPPPPELGYTVTVKDIDEEKRAALSKIQKVLETPAPESEKSAPPPAAVTTQLGTPFVSTSTLSGLLAAPLLAAPLLAAPLPAAAITLAPGPGSAAPAASNPLLEALKMKIVLPSSATSTANAAAASTASVQSSALKVSPVVVPPQLPPASSAGGAPPSAFSHVLGQVYKASSSTPAVTGSSLFDSAGPLGAANNPLLASGFKPIFCVTANSASAAPSAAQSQPPAQNFKPIFGAAPAGAGFGPPPPYTTAPPAATGSLSSASSVFGSMSGTTVTPSGFPGMTNAPACTGSAAATQPAAQPAAQPAGKSLFGNWSASTASAGPAPTRGSPFPFGAATTAAAATTSSSSPFTFGSAQPDAQAASQKAFAFGQAAPGQSSTTASFGGFGVTNTASTTTAAATQSNFTFGKSSFQAPAAQSTFGSTAPAQTTFGSTAPAQSTFGSTAPAQSTFGSTVAPAAQSTFGSTAPAQTTFGSTAPAQTTFGSTVAPAVQSTFGSTAPAQTTFGSTAPAQTTFGSTAPAQTTFGSMVAPAAQATFGSMAPAQTTFGSTVAPAAQSTFGSTAPAQTTFGSTAPAQTTFGSTVAPAVQSTFGSTAPVQSTFGSTVAPAAQSAFGSTVAAQTTFGSTAPAQTTFGSTVAPAAQSAFGSTVAAQTAFGSTAASSKPFSFGGAVAAPSIPASSTASFAFGSTAVTTATGFGTPVKPAFGGGAAGFPFGGTTAPSAAPGFGAAAQTQSPASFAFGGAPQLAPAGSAQPAPAGFNFSMTNSQFGTPVSNNPAAQMGGFNFGAAAPSSAPVFGQSAAAAGPTPFGSPGAPGQGQGFNAAPFGAPAAPSFSIGASSKPAGARQRLQARRHNIRKK